MMLHQVQQAIEPSLDLMALCQHWPDVAHSLAERPRKRQLQLASPLVWNHVECQKDTTHTDCGPEKR